MKFSKKQIREKVDELLDDERYEDACFLVSEGLSFLDGEGINSYNFDDEEFCQLMDD